jgi:TRAP-type uncharacterized transport system fused permease subunit
LQLQGVHKLAALALKNPLLEISKDEAEKLATAMIGVMKYHSINVSPGTLAWIQLAGVSAAVYGPRVAIAMATRKAAKPEKATATGPVAPLGGVDFTGQEPGKMRFN